MEPRCKQRYRTSVAIVGRIDNELIVDSQAPSIYGKAVVCLDDVFGPRAWQPSVSDDRTQTTGIEYAIRVAEMWLTRPAIPSTSSARPQKSPHAGSECGVDIGKRAGFDATPLRSQRGNVKRGQQEVPAPFPIPEDAWRDGL